MSRIINSFGGIFKVILVGLITFSWTLLLAQDGMEEVSEESKACITCHSKEGSGRGIVEQWKGSKHFSNGIGCFECHQAELKDVDAFDHYGEKIATIVSPLDCKNCHEEQVVQFEKSRHSKGAEFIGSLDNVLGEIIEGAAAAISGCRQCHGSTITLINKGKIDPATWPNTGIGRINPDESRGSCSACHSRHSFSKAQARQPEPCGKCHMGPDHPQLEIYNESKHGIKFATLQDVKEMKLDSDSWIAGKDYSAAPTCATCHISATPQQLATHDVGERISWTLRPVVSTKLDNWENKRENMKDVCNQCHASQNTENFYVQFDEAVILWNEKFAKPAKQIMDHFWQTSKLTKTPFDETIEWTYYELWHHEGRRARHGASMLGPDFTQWHGFYEVAKHFYTKFLPECEKIQKNVTNQILESEYHNWIKGMSEEQKKKILEFYKRRYGQ
jgi:hydroxylamine dehydrogenase